MDDVTRRRDSKAEPADAAPPTKPNVEFRFKITGPPVDAHGEKVTELVFREPTGADIVRSGNPIRLDLSMNEQAMEQQMSSLAAVPPSTIKMLTARDWQTIAFELSARFFVPVMAARTG
jgi:hypothetical protein